MTQHKISQSIKALKSSNTRKTAIKNLMTIGEPAVPKLIEALKSEDWHTCEAAAEALGEMGTIARAAEPALIAVLNTESAGYWDSDNLWWSGADVSAAGALGKIGSKKAVPALINVLRDTDRPINTRSAVVMALGNIGPDAKEAIPHLIKAQKHASGPYGSFRLEIYEALAKIGDASAVPLLVDYLRVESKRDATEEVIANLNTELKKRLRNQIPVLVKTIMKNRHKYWMERRAATYALGVIGGKEAVFRLNALVKDEDQYVRENAAKALGKTGDKATVPFLIEALKDEERGVRSNAAKALGMIGDETAVPALVEAIQDEDEYVRGNVVDALGLIGPKAKSAIPVLIKALGDKGFMMCQKSADALTQISTQAAMSAFSDARKCKDKYVRLVAQDALQKLKYDG